jgi:hypothetical protein
MLPTPIDETEGTVPVMYVEPAAAVDVWVTSWIEYFEAEKLSLLRK